MLTNFFNKDNVYNLMNIYDAYFFSFMNSSKFFGTGMILGDLFTVKSSHNVSQRFSYFVFLSSVSKAETKPTPESRH